MPEDRDDAPASARPRPFWSGTIAFGLVSVPVNLYSALRRDRVSLRMVDGDGTPLSRRYFCTREDVPIDWDEIVRGYEVEDDEYVIVADEELDELAPEKSREIDLRRFVPREEIDPGLFDRAYVLAPDKGSTKAYRLLVHAMASTDRAGIATFVMRGKEYLVAILSEGGLLLAETLRFEDELRSPEDVGLPDHVEATPAKAKAIAKALRAERAKELDEDLLTDRYAHRLRNLVEAKLEAGDDVLRALAEPEPEEAEEAGPPDLMQVLKESLASTAEGGGDTKRPAGRPPEGRHTTAKAGGRPAKKDLMERTKEELYERAKELDISGRSSMSKQELIEAIRS